MNRLKLTLKPVSAFATVPLGDTLFGQLCWQLRYLLGETALNQLLEGYTSGRPFAVVSDFLPSGYIPRPVLPSSKESLDQGKYNPQELIKRRKELKKLQWVPLAKINEPVGTWVNYAEKIDLGGWFAQYRNSINRLTGTTGKEGFAPYEVNQFWYYPEKSKSDQPEKAIILNLDCYIDYDPERISRDRLQEAMRQMGLSGFGKDASVGAGRFEIVDVSETSAPVSVQRQVITLSNCVPSELNLCRDESFYKLFVRFGRHGAEDVYTGKPFKAPILMAERGALLTLNEPLNASFIGVGLGGQGELSNAREATVHQGYAPVFGVNNG